MTISNWQNPYPGPSTKALTRAAKENQVVIIASLFEKRTQGIYHNAQPR
jgi:N-carbamoylputrescine amidase